MDQTNQEQSTQPVRKITKPFRPSWWLWAIIIVAAIGIVAVLIVKFTTKNSTATSATTKPDTTEEIKIKQYMSSLRGDIVRFHDEKQTYQGWTPSALAVTQVKQMGSELKTQALTKDTYIIFAKMPSSKTVFCMDAKGFTSEVKSLMSWSTTCQ